MRLEDKAGQVESGGEANEESVRARILRGAAAAFARQGFGATAVEAILEASGVSRRTFYKYFKNKEEVFRTLFDISVQRLAAAVRTANDEGDGTAVERMVRAVEAYISMHANAGPLARVMLLEQLAPGSPLGDKRREAMVVFAKLIRSSARRSGLDDPDPFLVNGVVAAINQICIDMAAEYPDGDWDIERAKRAVLRALIALDDRSDPTRWTEPLYAAMNGRDARGCP